MKISISLGGALAASDISEQVTYVQEAEKLGVESVWTVEGWGRDAVTPLAYIAGQTERIRLGTSIMQISARTPSMTAMTALSLAAMSGNRFILGLGASGPQIVEGMHNQQFAEPLTRMRETVEILRLAFAGEKLEFQGRHFRLPLPVGEARAIRLSEGPNPHIPIYLAALGPKSLRYTGQVADGWIGTAFTPEHGAVLLDEIREGADESGREYSSLDIHVGAAAVSFDEDIEALIDSERMGKAFTLGAMGSASANFYHAAYQRSGWREAADEVQALWLAGDRAAAAARVPADMIAKTNLFGDEAAIRERLKAYARAGVTTLKVQPKADTLEERLAILGQLMDVL